MRGYAWAVDVVVVVIVFVVVVVEKDSLSWTSIDALAVWRRQPLLACRRALPSPSVTLSQVRSSGGQVPPELSPACSRRPLLLAPFLARDLH